MLSYSEFLNRKRFTIEEAGFDASIPSSIDSVLFDYQRDIIKWACRRGKAAIFADTGLGKSLMQLTWADQVARLLDQSSSPLTSSWRRVTSRTQKPRNMIFLVARHD